jgi:two-component system response regulator FlrC
MSGDNKIISIVDDDPDTTELFREAMSGVNGVTVLVFNDSLKALKHFTDNKSEYILVITDLRMPGIDGLQLLTKMKKTDQYLRTILMSAYGVCNDLIIRQYLNEGIIDRFIQKPITISSLCQEVNNQIHAYQLKM